MFGAVDSLASEYGWTKDYILFHITPDDLRLLGPIIRKRRLEKQLTDSRIALHPHTDRKVQQEYTRTLMNELRAIDGLSTINDTIDHAGIAALKQKLTKSKNIGVK